MSARIRIGDTVEVRTGKFSGTRGRVLQVDAKSGRVKVERVNLVKKHQRPSSQQRQGGIIEKEASIHVSNVMLVHKGEPTRLGVRVQDGKRVRWSLKHNEAIDG
jgi:large subunit ribosomal protein L24